MRKFATSKNQKFHTSIFQHKAPAAQQSSIYDTHCSISKEEILYAGRKYGLLKLVCRVFENVEYDDVSTMRFMPTFSWDMANQNSRILLVNFLKNFHFRMFNWCNTVPLISFMIVINVLSLLKFFKQIIFCILFWIFMTLNCL